MNSMNVSPTASVTIRDMKNNVLYQQEFAPKDNNESKSCVKEWVQQYGQSRPGFGVLEGLIMTRIDSKENFTKDFFMPTVVNLAAKVENVVGRFFACFFAAILDLISLPIRFIAFPIWAIYTVRNPESEHPLTALIRNGPASQEQIAYALKEGMVTCEYKIHNCVLEGDRELVRSMKVNLQATERDLTGSIDIALKRVPGGIKSREKEETFTKISLLFPELTRWVTISTSSSKSETSHMSA